MIDVHTVEKIWKVKLTWQESSSSEGFTVITARKRSCGKVMFLQVSVILLTGGWVGGGYPIMPCTTTI